MTLTVALQDHMVPHTQLLFILSITLSQLAILIVAVKPELLLPPTLTLELSSISQLEVRLMMLMAAHQDLMEHHSQLLLITSTTLSQLVTLIVAARQELLPLLTSIPEPSSISQPVLRLMMLTEALQDLTELHSQLLLTFNWSQSQHALLLNATRAQLLSISPHQTKKLKIIVFQTSVKIKKS